MTSLLRASLAALSLLALPLAGLATGCAVAPVEDEAAAAGSQTEVSPLSSSDHASVTDGACRAAGLPKEFCLRLAVEAVNVDRTEWTTLPAHAQKEMDQSSCDGAAAVQDRLHALGSEVRTLIAAGKSSTDATNGLARALGRALHTVQDNCAHAGMTNEQHSWLTNREICVADNQSPDKDPEGVTCAREETAAVMSAFHKAVGASALDTNALSAATDAVKHSPTRGQACEFMHLWKKFDGVDTRWSVTTTREAFRKTLTDAFVSEAAPAELCANGSAALASETTRARVEVTDPTCAGVAIVCIGK
jgi:hypothetical protein